MTSAVQIHGRLTKDPELRFVASGRAVANFSLAFEKLISTEPKETRVSFIDITAWGSLAENVARSCHKGTMVTVTGHLEQETWEDRQGQRKSRIKVVAYDVAVSLKFVQVEIHRNQVEGRINAPTTNEDSGGLESAGEEDDDEPF